METLEVSSSDAGPVLTGQALDFELLPQFEGRDIYNPSTPFQHQGQWYILGRIESPDREDDSVVGLFDIDTREQVSANVIPNMQDPYHLGVFLLDGRDYNVFGGVQFEPNGFGGVQTWRERIYRCPVEEGHPLIQADLGVKSPIDLIATGVEKWKDTRIIQIDENLLGVFPRPQGDFGGLGRVGYFETPNMQTLEYDLLKFAHKADDGALIRGLCQDGEWVGTNQIVSYNPNDSFTVVGHRGRIVTNEEGQKFKNYEAISFDLDRYSRQVSDLKVIATADNFEPIKAKLIRDSSGNIGPVQLGKVVFPGGWGFNPFRGEAKAFWGGLGDATVAIGHVALTA